MKGNTLFLQKVKDSEGKFNLDPRHYEEDKMLVIISEYFQSIFLWLNV